MAARRRRTWTLAARRIGRRMVSRRRSPATSGPRLTPLSERASVEMGYSSQLGQDAFLDRFVFAGARGGTFVDVGAHDGVTFSNSLFFERSRGWTGLCIEPLPAPFERLAAQRTAQCVNVAVTAERGVTRFRSVSGYAEMLSGVEARYDRRHKRRMLDEVTRHGGSSTVVEVATERLDVLLLNAGMNVVDLVSIDVEGGELGVLDSIVLADFCVQAVVIENNFGERSIERALRRQGFQLLAHIGADEVYVPLDWRWWGPGD